MKLYKNLENLKNLSDAFYSAEQDIKIKDTTYTVKSYTYRLASYTEFNYDNAKDSRGTAYYTEKGKDDWKLFCRAYPKFWNLGEITCMYSICKPPREIMEMKFNEAKKRLSNNKFESVEDLINYLSKPSKIH